MTDIHVCGETCYHLTDHDGNELGVYHFDVAGNYLGCDDHP